ncbi:MAG: hypothetical protein DWP92_00760 [Armatimonadetes bacterium]|nr:MAG: hypothetical protein DWP92_00760 [Armatimonadota bacterium]
MGRNPLAATETSGSGTVVVVGGSVVVVVVVGGSVVVVVVVDGTVLVMRTDAVVVAPSLVPPVQPTRIMAKISGTEASRFMIQA